MKSNWLKYFIFIFSLALLYGCNSQSRMMAPTASLPVRDQLPEDVYGGYITITRRDSAVLSGELIGMRSDSLYVLSDTMKSIHRDQIASARVIVHLPNNYRKVGFPVIGASGLVILQAAEYAEGPLMLGLGSMALNGLALYSAQATEDLKVNYYDWSEGWQKVMAYSRFPYNIPDTIRLSELEPRHK